MSQLCHGYLKKRISKVNTGITKGPSHDDDYGFLCPNGKVICPKVIKDQVNPMRSVTFQEEMIDEHTCMLTTETYQRNNDTMDSGYLSPVNSSNNRSHNSTLSPIYYSIETPAGKIIPEKSSSQRHSNILNKSNGANNVSNLGDYTNTSMSSSRSSKCRRSLLSLYNMTNGAGHNNDSDCGSLSDKTHRFTLSDIEAKLNRADVHTPANILMMVVKSHIPKTFDSGEIKVIRGVFVTGLFKTRNWIRVKLSSNSSGYIPYGCVKPVGVKMCRDFTQQHPLSVTLGDTVQFSGASPSSGTTTRDGVPSLPPSPVPRGSLYQPRGRHSHAGYSSDCTYVQADNIYEHIYMNDNEDDTKSECSFQNRSVLSPPPCPLRAERPRCILNETIEKSKTFINKRCNQPRQRKLPICMDDANMNLTPAFSKHVLAHCDKSNQSILENTMSSYSTATSGDSSINDSMDNTERTKTNIYKCYICKKTMKSTSSPHNNMLLNTNKKYTCSNCVLFQLTSTSSMQETSQTTLSTNERSIATTVDDFGYESAKSEHITASASSNINTRLCYSSESDLIQSIETLNMSHDSGQDSCSYSENSYRLPSPTDSYCSLTRDNTNNDVNSINNNMNSNAFLESSRLADIDDVTSISSFALSSPSLSSSEKGANLTVLFDYSQTSSHDLSLKKQDIVTLLYDKHDMWYWVRNRDGVEGYVPKNYVVNLEKLNLDPATKTTYL